MFKLALIIGIIWLKINMQSEIFLNGKRYLSTKKATKIIELDEEHIKDLCREEKIDFTKVEGEYFVELEKLFEYKNKTNKPMSR
ncbi:MAG: hypothetical protein UR74_C0001G0328 [Candidatus Campbellbacteria bacterium GW2011_GWD2_35_24]|nr:MAG: hypothetical protein UR74_C0001G0328 [Candidatus Campbellbacteria bacterium GW2011_GWD2_35_24]